MIRFRACNCGAADLHGYLYKDDTEDSVLPVVIISAAGARYLVDQIKKAETELVGREEEIVSQVLNAGLPETADNDIAAVNEGLLEFALSATFAGGDENDGANVLQV